MVSVCYFEVFSHMKNYKFRCMFFCFTRQERHLYLTSDIIFVALAKKVKNPIFYVCIIAVTK